MTTKQPLVTKRITHRSGTFTIKVILQRPQNRRTRFDRLRKGLVYIGHVQVNGEARATERPWSADAVLYLSNLAYARRRTPLHCSHDWCLSANAYSRFERRS